jgi:hypothetical protein
MNTFTFLLAINSAAQPALYIAFTIALLLALCATVFIYGGAINCSVAILKS